MAKFNNEKFITLLKRKKALIAAIVLIAVSLTGFNIFAEKKPKDNDFQVSDNNPTVQTETVKLSDSLGGLTYKANLEPAETAAISSRVSGQVTGVYFEIGDKVAQGQTLVQLDDKDLQNQLRTAQIDLSKLQVDLDGAKSDYDIASQLYAEGACSKTGYDDAARAYKTAQANVELKKVSIQDIYDSIGDCVIKAPITGEIGAKNINLGQFTNPGTVIGSVNNNSSIKAEIQLMQEDLEKVAVGQKVTLKLNKDSSTSYQGVVETIAASANSQTRVFDCLIRIDNSAGILNSGTFGYIEIPNKNKTKVLEIPMTAVMGSEGDYSVFVFRNGAACRVPVEVGQISNDMVEITSGLNEGDQVIITNLNSLQDGDKVTASGEGA
jgi:RND family efflux transporter, MFP subunit